MAPGLATDASAARVTRRSGDTALLSYRVTCREAKGHEEKKHCETCRGEPHGHDSDASPGTFGTTVNRVRHVFRLPVTPQRSRREIVRILKRYVAREVYPHLRG